MNFLNGPGKSMVFTMLEASKMNRISVLKAEIYTEMQRENDKVK